MINKTLLLDFDGVIFRNKWIERTVVRRIERVAQRNLRINNDRLVTHINQQLYSTFGHTLIGLEKFGCHISLQDFNKEIYNLDYEFLYNQYYKQQDDIKSLERLKNWCDENETKILIFSNAPYIWCRSFLDLMSYNFIDIEILNNFDSSWFLKPNINSYLYIEKTIDTDLIFFVDDKWINFNPVLEKKRWINIFFSDIYYKINDKTYIVSDFLQITDILNKSDRYFYKNLWKFEPPFSR